MAKKLKLTSDYILERIDIDNCEDFFQGGIEIAPNTSVYVFDCGQYTGTVSSGSYQLDSFATQLKFWSQGPSIFYLLPDSFLPVNYTSCKYKTKDGYLVSADIHIEFSIYDPSPFIKNFAGIKEKYRTEDFCSDSTVFVLDSLQECFRRFTMEELSGIEARKYLNEAMEKTVSTSLKRYGIKFENLTIQSLVPEKRVSGGMDSSSDEPIRDSLDVKNEDNERFIAQRKMEIEQDDKIADLKLLAEKNGVDFSEEKMDLHERRIGLAKRLRDLHRTDKIDSFKSEVEIRRFLFEQDKDKVLRDQEMNDLVLAVRTDTNEKEMKSSHFLKKLELQIDAEIDDMTREYEYKVKMDRLNKESELAARVDTEDNRKWERQIEREKKERSAALEKLKDNRIYNQENASSELEERIHKQRMDLIRREEEEKEYRHRMSVKGEVNSWEREEKLLNATNITDIREVESIQEHKEKDRELGYTTKKTEEEIRLQGIKRAGAMETLRQMQEMRQTRQQTNLDMQLKKNEAENEAKINELKLHQEHEIEKQKQEQERIRVLQGFGKEGILGVLSTDGLDAYVKSNENAKDAEIAKIRLEEQQRAREEENRRNEEFRREEQYRNRETQAAQDQSKKDIMNLFSEVLNSKDRDAERLVRMHTDAPQTQAPIIVTPPFPGAIIAPTVCPDSSRGGNLSNTPEQKPVENKVLICPHCRAEIKETQRFCSNCGHQI